jgi:hypothetical protein
MQVPEILVGGTIASIVYLGRMGRIKLVKQNVNLRRYIV